MGVQIDMFHNTTQLPVMEKAAKEVKASNQNEKVLALFREHKYCDFTPAEVFLKFGQQYPITSIRRAITDMEKMGLLLKTQNKREGLFGDPNGCWKCNPFCTQSFDEARIEHSKNVKP